MGEQQDSAFDIHVDPSCLSTPMDDDVPPGRQDTPKAVQTDAPAPEEPATEVLVAEASVEQLLQDTVDELQNQQDAAASLRTTPKPEEEDQLGDDSLLSAGDESADQTFSPRPSSPSGRRISGRTDALIQAAARAVVDQIERNRHEEEAEPFGLGSVMSSAINYGSSYTEGTEASYFTETDLGTEAYDSRRESYLSESQASTGPGHEISTPSQAPTELEAEAEAEDESRRESLISESHDSVSQRRVSETPSQPPVEQEVEEESRRESYTSESQVSVNQRRESDTPSQPAVDQEIEDRGGDSSSHHDADSEVFSERSHSARSSLGSFEDHRSHKDDDAKSQVSHHLDDDNMTQRTRSPRISDFSQYDREEFVPTIRGAPRLPFRTPSDVRALQMSSPPPSVFGGSPRSAKRHLPTISRLGSPSPSAQYSPKGRTTPSRLKPRKVTPPLVLLHATILPLRWPWGDVLEGAPSASLTPEAKTLRESWRFLHDRLGDTVCERGILLPHPQNDYEVLEERLLDALELPLRRRARILECGHYVGPANETTLTEDIDSDDEGEGHPRHSMSSSAMSPARSSVGTLGGRQTHWCSTCNHEIKFEALGPGKVFRVKVYASNGLMKAGAWEACWKEMERVDVEIEPIINGAELQDELERLAVTQREDAERAAEEEEAAQAAAELDEPMYEEEETYIDHQLPPSSPPTVDNIPASPSPDSSISRHDQAEERRVRDEARMREIYGEDTPAATNSVPLPGDTTEAAAHHSHENDSPVSPSEEARARREARRSSGKPGTTLQNATLPELLLEAVRVLLQDRKNVALVLLSCLVLFMAVKPAGRDDAGLREWDGAFNQPEIDVAMPKVPEVEVVGEPDIVDEVKSIPSAAASAVADAAPVNEPCETPKKPEGVEDVEAVQHEAEKKESEQQAAPPAPEVETVVSREVVRVVETVTETETIKAYVTETAQVVEEEVSEQEISEEEPSKEDVPEEDASEAETPVVFDEGTVETEPKQESVPIELKMAEAVDQSEEGVDAENIVSEEPVVVAEEEL